MKTFFFFLSNLVTIAGFSAGENAIRIPANIDAVTLYLNGAEITQRKSVNLLAGRNQLVFTGVSPKLVSKSIQARLPEEIAILSISEMMNYLSPTVQNPRIRRLTDSLEILKDVSGQLHKEKEVYETEKRMIMKNESIGGNNNGVSIAELKLAADFYRSRLKDINAELLRIEKRERENNEKLISTNQQLNELNAKNNQPTAEITLLVNAPSATTVTVELRYLVSDAGWQPSYDLKATDINQPIELKYRAKIYNNTGIAWNEVKLKLSTADPNQSAAKPQMDPWVLSYSNDLYKQKSVSNTFGGNTSDLGYLNQAGVMTEKKQQAGKFSTIDPVQPAPVFIQIQVSELSAEFDIKTNYTIPSDNKPYIVDVTVYNLPATYKHYSIPKIDRDAFLLARITGWEDLDLVEGPANVFFAGTYVGQSYIQTRSVDDTLDLSLGRDKKVIVTRTKKKDYSISKMIGNMKKETYAFEIIVKNNRKSPVTITIEDQVPISQDSEITVEVLETSGASQDAVTGTVKWDYSLQPDESKKTSFSYSIKFPRNKSLNTKKSSHRTVRFM